MKHTPPVWLILLLLAAGTIPVLSHAVASQELEDLPLTQLEMRLEEIDDELEQLSNYSLRSGVGSIGFRSTPHTVAENTEWIQIDLGKEYPIDEIVLVPTIWRDTKQGFRSDAFPQAFRIWAGTTSNSEGNVIAEYASPQDSSPRLAPLLIHTPETTASWVRIEATRLSQRSFDNQYVLQLAEVLVFSGQDNVALLQPVITRTNAHDSAGAWDNRFLVDGFMPYLMDSAHGEKSQAFITDVGQVPVMTMDLGKAYPISRIHLHSVDQSDTVPQAYAGDLGIPRHLKIEGAKLPDFSDSVLLLDYLRESINDTGPIIMRRIQETTCRYVRFTAVEFPNDPSIDYSSFRLGFAEIELISNDRNVALGAKVDATIEVVQMPRKLSALTDGKNLYGNILPIRDWIEELARRHDLEVERPLVAAELNHRYTRQKANLRLMSTLIGLLVVAIGFIILIDRNLRMRQATRIKERFAADLHDELGADLHALGLLTDLAKDSVDSKDELLELLDRTRVFTERSGMAARYCTNMLEAKGLCEDLVDEMRRTSQRMLTDLQYELIFEGEEILHNLKPRRRIDLYFFYKESLTNILRHSGATKVRIRISANEKQIRLAITDNGHGIKTSGSLDDAIPPSLKRRARLLRAKVSMEQSADGGARIFLILKIRRFPFFK